MCKTTWPMMRLRLDFNWDRKSCRCTEFRGTKACAINSKHRSCDETMHFRCWVPFWFCTNICNHATKERVHYVFWHQTKACAASTTRQICVTFVNKILHDRYIYTIISIKKRSYHPTTNQNGAHGTTSQQPNWSHDLCLLLIAQALSLIHIWRCRRRG